MPGYKLTIEGEDIEIFFEKGEACNLTIDGVDAYEFSEAIDGIGGLTITSSVEFFSQEDYNVEPIEEDSDLLLEKDRGGNNCCMFRNRTWCVVNGCMRAPCGKICG